MANYNTLAPLWAAVANLAEFVMSPFRETVCAYRKSSVFAGNIASRDCVAAWPQSARKGELLG